MRIPEILYSASIVLSLANCNSEESATKKFRSAGAKQLTGDVEKQSPQNEPAKDSSPKDPAKDVASEPQPKPKSESSECGCADNEKDELLIEKSCNSCTADLGLSEKEIDELYEKNCPQLSDPNAKDGTECSFTYKGCNFGGAVSVGDDFDSDLGSGHSHAHVLAESKGEGSKENLSSPGHSHSDAN